MATFPVSDAAYPTPDEIRDIILAAIAFAYATEGVVANVLPGSDHYIRATGYADQLSIPIQNNKLALAAISPLTASGDDLVTLAAVFGVAKRPAVGSSGLVIIRTTGTVTIPAGYQCTAANGLKYQTVTIETEPNLGKVLIQAVGTGIATNLAAGAQVKWDASTVGGLKPVANVDIGGIDGGAEADTDETLRRRLLNRLAFPGVGGNSAQVIQLAEGASAGIEYAFVYPAARGPGSYDVAITIADGDRTASVLLQSQAAGAIVAQLPGHTSLNLTSVSKQEVDIVFEATLPYPANAGGPGGGWRDGVPWPTEITKITSLALPAVIVDATVSPVIGQNIGMWDNVAQVMREYTITDVGGGPGAYEIEVQGGFQGDFAAGSFISAGAVGLTQYATAALAEFNKLGPGEKTDNPDILPRGRRTPSADVLAPPNIGSRIITGIESQFSEIELTYAARYVTGSTTTITGPSLPPSTSDPPRIIVLKHLAFTAP